MVLDFGLIGTTEGVISSDYKSADSHQRENLKYLLTQAASTWVEIYTVPDGKTWYVTGVILHTNDGTNRLIQLGVGAAAAESVIMSAFISLTNGFQMAMPTPLKFQSGERITGRINTASDGYYTLIGFEE